MKKFRFQLERVLHIRQAEERLAALRLAELTRRESQLERLLARCREEGSGLDDAVRAKREQAPLPLRDLQMLELEIERLRRARRHLGEQLQRVRSQSEKARIELLECNRAKRVLERLRSRRRVDHRREYLSRAERAAEELAQCVARPSP